MRYALVEEVERPTSRLGSRKGFRKGVRADTRPYRKLLNITTSELL